MRFATKIFIGTDNKHTQHIDTQINYKESP
jgi:hypothetical protein